MNVRWTSTKAQYIMNRSSRYPDATDIKPEWVDEAARDPRAVVRDPDPKSKTGAVRIVGYSPTAGFVVTVIADWIEDELWRLTAWKTSGAERRSYQKGRHDESI